jgi:hypothetical protein
LLSAIAVCCGVLMSSAQPSAHRPSSSAVSPQWTAGEPAGSSVPLDRVPEWTRTAPDTPRLTAARPDSSAGESDDDDDGDNDDAPGMAMAPARTTVTADSGHTQHAAPHDIGRRTSHASYDHSLRAPPQ